MTRLTAERSVGLDPMPLCTLEDLTDLPRVGFRGTDSAAYLTARGFSLPDVPNRAVSQTEYLLLGSAQDQGQHIADEEASWEMDHNAHYLLPREDSHAWLQLSGVCISEVMAKLCGVDLRAQAFPPGAVAQTSAARINVIVVNVGARSEPSFQILFDRASLAYFKDALLDAMAEFDGVSA